VRENKVKGELLNNCIFPFRKTKLQIVSPVYRIIRFLELACLLFYSLVYILEVFGTFWNFFEKWRENLNLNLVLK